MSRRVRTVLAGLVPVLLACWLPAPAWSAGSGVFGGPARATGAATLWNAAALVEASTTWMALLDLGGMAIYLDYQRTGRDPRTGSPYSAVESNEYAPNPQFTLLAPTPWPALRLFVGGFSPSTLSTGWPEDGPNRYHGTNAAIITYAVPVGIVVAIADRVGLALGAGPTFGYLSARYAMDFGAYANGQLPPGAQLLPLEDPQLEGRVHATGTGWSTTWVAGAWGRPVSWLRLGASLMWPLDITFRGTVALTGSDALATALPGFDLDATGVLEAWYPMYPQVQAEAEVQWGRLRAGLLWQYIFCGTGESLQATISQADLEFLNGPQPSTGDMRGDWLVGLRVSGQVAERWEVGGRLDLDPTSVPDEVLQPANLDFSTLHLALGTRWRPSDRHSLALSYALVLGAPVHVTRSVYNPYAPPSSGLAMPSGNGDYRVQAHVLTLQYAGGFGRDGR